MAAAAKTASKAPAKPRTRKPAAAKAAAPKARAAKAASPKTAAPKRPAPKTATARAAPPKASASKAKAAPAKAPPRLGLISAIAVGVVAAGSAIALFGRRLFAPGNAEHPAPDLALDQPHNDGSRRAPDAFRPDPTAAVPASEREGLRPATGIPSLVTH